MSKSQKRPLPSDFRDPSEVTEKKSAVGRVIPDWKAAVRKAYPALLTKSYFVPPVHKNKTKYLKEKQYREKGQPALIPQCPARNEMQNDHAQQTVLHCFDFLAKSQVMFVLSGMQFKDFPKFTEKDADLDDFPKIWNLRLDDKKDESDVDKKNGEFDILVLHRHLGILNTEIKSVAFHYDDNEWNEKQIEAVSGKVRDAVNQIDERKTWIRKHMSRHRLDPTCRLTRSICLPYVTRAKLKDILEREENVPLKKRLCRKLDIPEDSDPTIYCLLKDEMPEKTQPWDISPDVEKALKEWWTLVMASQGEDANMTDEKYVNIVSKFCGPATGMKLRTLGEGVSHLGDEFTRLVLTPEQVQILKNDHPKVCIMGPPGVGKTIMLIQKALDWMKQDVDVHIVGIHEPAMAAAEMIYAELKESRKQDPKRLRGHVYVHHTDSEDRGPVVDDLKSAAEKGKIAVVMDESGRVPFEKLTDMLSDLTKVAQIDKVWVAGAANRCELSNASWTHVVLLNPLRTPPSVTREVEKSDWSHIKYEATEAPLPGDGPKPIHLYHQPGQDGHSDSDIDCFQCGKNIAKFLKEELHIEPAVDSRKEEEAQKKKKKNKSTEPTPLRFKDVFILTDFLQSKAEKFADGLEEGGVPFQKVRSGDKPAIKRMMGRNRPDKVVLSDVSTVNGLERKVVVWKLWGTTRTSEENFGRLYGVSRCCSQLVFAWASEEKKSTEGPVSGQSAGQEMSVDEQSQQQMPSQDQMSAEMPSQDQMSVEMPSQDQMSVEMPSQD